MSTDVPQGSIGAILRGARDATSPSEAQVARLGARLTDGTIALPSAVWRWRLALIALLLLSTGGAVGAASLLLKRLHPAPAAPLPRSALQPRRGYELALARAHVGGARSVDPSAPPQPVVAPPPVKPPRAERSAARRTVPASGPPEVAPVREAQLLAGAFRALRTDHDAGGALRTLDGYDRAFPHGALASEARIARAEALMALQRDDEALSVLESLDDQRAFPTRNVLVMRGELLVRTGNCSRAVRDFESVLRGGARGDAEARALFGRGACRLRDGAVADGRRDLQKYLDLYPHGAFADAVRESLRSRP